MVSIAHTNFQTPLAHPRGEVPEEPGRHKRKSASPFQPRESMKLNSAAEREGGRNGTFADHTKIRIVNASKNIAKTSGTSHVSDSLPIFGFAVFVDDQGRRHKILVSYDLNVRSCAPFKQERVVSFTKMSRIEVTIPESHKRRETRQQQFRIYQTTIAIDPIVDQISNEMPDDYSDLWITHGQHPDELAWASDAVLGTAADLKKSSISTSPDGGMEWKYVVSTNSSIFEHHIGLESHGGEISFSNYFPNSIEALVSTILELTGNSRSSLVSSPFFRKSICDIGFGYRQISVSLRTRAIWDEHAYAQCPIPTDTG
jgi:hypothetical protein